MRLSLRYVVPCFNFEPVFLFLVRYCRRLLAHRNAHKKIGPFSSDHRGTRFRFISMKTMKQLRLRWEHNHVADSWLGSLALSFRRTMSSFRIEIAQPLFALWRGEFPSFCAAHKIFAILFGKKKFLGRSFLVRCQFSISPLIGRSITKRNSSDLMDDDSRHKKRREISPLWFASFLPIMVNRWLLCCCCCYYYIMDRKEPHFFQFVKCAQGVNRADGIEADRLD